MLNIIFGIIIDSFGDLRDKRTNLIEKVTGKCFICGLTKFELDTRGEGWYNHIYKNHNAYNYLFFIIMMRKKEKLDCNGTEKYIKEMMSKNDITYLPQASSLSLENGGT